ncbi:MAG: diacylglycerol kinase family lipid kinase [Firmicutes bacterium]|nr:diacylglycerol kinase family lipid kinase [Bacillota bacterium]
MRAARIIVNPTAGNGKALKLFHALKPYLASEDVEICQTEQPGHATQLAREVANESDLTVVSLGGDGTHHEVINGLMPEGKAIFAILPAGTGNDFVRALDYPHTPREMLEVALHGPLRMLDLGQVNGQFFLTVSGVGFDAEVAGWVNQHEKHGSGTWIFLRAILRHLVSYRAQPMTVHAAGASREEKTFMLALGNTAQYAGGMRICPDARPDDGMFQVIWVKDLTRLSVLPLLARVFRGTHVRHPRVETFPADQLRVEGPDTLWVHADGEIVGHLPATFQVKPKAIRVRTGPVPS